MGSSLRSITNDYGELDGTAASAVAPTNAEDGPEQQVEDTLSHPPSAEPIIEEQEVEIVVEQQASSSPQAQAIGGGKSETDGSQTADEEGRMEEIEE